MTPKFILLVSATIFSLSTHADLQASNDDGRYWGLGLSQISIDAFDINAVTGKLGYAFADYLSLESRLSFGLDDRTVNDVSMEVEYNFAAYLRIGLPIAKYVYPYAILGYSRTSLSASNQTQSEDIRHGFSYGGGFNYYLHETTTIDVELVRYYKESDTNINAIFIGVTGNF